MGKSKSDMMWPTPSTITIVRTAEGMEKGIEYRASVGRKYVEGCLAEQVNNWPTPNSCDSNTANMKDNHDVDRRYLRGVAIQDKPQGKLNPDWVEQLMGLPPGWTQLSGAEPGGNRIDRLRLLGNGVVPATAEKAFRTLLGRIDHERF